MASPPSSPSFVSSASSLSPRVRGEGATIALSGRGGRREGGRREGRREGKGEPAMRTN
jgi:hypothetical protein